MRMAMGMGFQSPAGSSDTPETYDYLINNLAELRAVDLDAVAVSVGKGAGQTLVVALAPGNYFPDTGAGELWAWNITSTYASANGADVLFTGQYSDNRPVIDVIKWDGGVTPKVRFRHMVICSRRWEPNNPAYASGATAGVVTSLSQNLNGAFRVAGTTGTPPDFEIGVRFTGNYRGDHTHEYDPTDVLISPGLYENRYPEAAHIRATLVGGTYTALNIDSSSYDGGAIIHRNQYVGDNCNPAWIDSGTGMIADGEYPLFLDPRAASTGSGFEGYMTTANGRIVSTRLVSGGTGYTTAGAIIQWHIWWDKKRTFVSWLPSGCVTKYGGSGSLTDHMQYSDVEFANSYTGIRIIPTTGGELTVKRCFFDRLYSDGVIMPISDGDRPNRITLQANVFKEAWALGSDPCDPHSDFMQAFYSGVFTSPIDIMIAGNVAITGRSRGGGASGWLTTDMLTGNYGISGYFIANYILTRQQGNGVFLGPSGDFLYANNVNVRFDVSETSYNQNIVATTVVDAVGQVGLRDNVSEIISVSGGTGSAEMTSNIILGFNGATIPYADVFANPLARPLTRADVLTSFATIGAAASDGPQAGGVFNWATLEPDLDAVAPFVKFDTVIGQDAAVDAYTPWTRLLGGLASGTITCSGTGMSFQIADDYLGTGAGSQLTTYTGVKRDKWIRLKCDAIITGLTQRTANLVIDSTNFSWSVNSASVLTYTKVDNQATAYSSIIIPSQGGLTVDRMVLAMYFDLDTIVTSSRQFTGTANGQSLLMNYSATLPTAQLGTSGGVFRRRLQSTPTLDTDQLWILLIDLAETGEARCKWMVNTGMPALDSIINGTQTSMNIDTALATPYRLFASVSGAQIQDIKPSMFFLDWWSQAANPTYTMPDVGLIADTGDATYEANRLALFNSFQRDLIGADGSGPLGRQPKLCFYGDAGASDGSTADTWNNNTTGLLNRGSLSTAAIRVAGTYV